jgi:hypothetical protein
MIAVYVRERRPNPSPWYLCLSAADVRTFLATRGWSDPPERIGTRVFEAVQTQCRRFAYPEDRTLAFEAKPSGTAAWWQENRDA